MNLKIQLPIIFLLFAFCFLLYYSTLCPNVTWAHFSENSPKLLTQIYTEPLSLDQKPLPYLATAKLYSLLIIHYSLFIFDPAFPLNLLSALFSSLTIVVTYFIIFSLSPILKLPSHLTRPLNLAWLPAAFGSLALALSLTFWSQALVSQTASFNIFLSSLSLLFLLKIWRHPSEAYPTSLLKKASRGTLFAFIHRHSPWLSAKEGKSPKKKVQISLILFLGFTLILFLNNIPAGLSSNLRTPRQFWDNLETIVSLILANFSGSVLLLALVGLFFGLEKRVPLLVLPSILFGQSLLDSVFATSTTPPFFLPSFLVIALLSGLGLKVLLEIILAISFSDLAVSFENRFFLLILRFKKAGKFLRYIIFCALGYFIFMIILTNIREVYPLIDLKNEREALNFGQNSLAVLPENSLVFCETDKLLYTLEYFQKVVRHGKQFELLAFAENTKEVVKENLQKRPVFFALVMSPIPVGETKGIWEGYALVSRGPLYQVQKSTLFQ